MSKPSVDEMRCHVLNIAAEADLTVSWCRRPTQAWAAREIEEIQIALIRSEVSYSTALHELGHILGRHQRSRQLMVRERWAWEWARTIALAWTDRMAKNRGESLRIAAQTAAAGVRLRKALPHSTV